MSAITHRGAVDRIFNASQTGDPGALGIPPAMLAELIEWSLVSPFTGGNGGSYLTVTDQGKQILRGQFTPKHKTTAA